MSIWKSADEVPKDDSHIYRQYPCRVKGEEWIGLTVTFIPRTSLYVEVRGMWARHTDDGYKPLNNGEMKDLEWLDPSALDEVAIVESFLEKVKNAMMPHETLDGTRVIRIIDEQLTELRTQLKGE